MIELNNIYNNDFRDECKNIKDDTFDCVIIDPPYSGATNKTATGTRMRQDKGNHIDYDDMSERVFLKFMQPIIKELYRVTKLGGHFYCFTDWKQSRNMMDLIELSSFKIVNLICWDKKQMGLGGGYRPRYEMIIVASKGISKPFNRKDLSNVLQFSRVHKKSHPHEKPLELIDTLITNSTQEGDLVLDAFCGTGVVPVSCKNNNRNFVAYEINNNFVEIANERLNNLEITN